MKVAINSSVGGFTLSKAAFEYIGLKWDGYGNIDWKYEELLGEKKMSADYLERIRSHPKVVECIEVLGEKSYGQHSRLIKIVEIPDDIEWEIHCGEAGYEWIAEKHRTWC